MSELGAKLKIEQHGLSPHCTKVWLNDQDITGCLHQLTVEFNPGELEVTTATLVIDVRDLECDARSIAHLIAQMHEGNPALIEETIRALKHIKAGVDQ